MNELIGLAYYAEIPAVVIDVQRVGPSTGMPTRTQQGDILECAYASHGDTRHILLFPSNPAECFEFAVKSFDLAERFQTPVFMLSDLDIGMNDWVTPALTWDDAFRPDRGRVLTAESWNRARSISAIRRGMRASSRRAPCPACTPRAYISSAARGTTSWAATRRSRTNTRK